MTALVSLEQSMADAVKRIEDCPGDARSILKALTHGCALLEGYYRAGGASRFDFEHGCAYLKRVARQRAALNDLREAAIAEGLGSDE